MKKFTSLMLVAALVFSLSVSSGAAESTASSPGSATAFSPIVEAEEYGRVFLTDEETDTLLETQAEPAHMISQEIEENSAFAVYPVFLDSATGEPFYIESISVTVTCCDGMLEVISSDFSDEFSTYLSEYSLSEDDYQIVGLYSISVIDWVNCPYCGEDADLNSDGTMECPYCGNWNSIWVSSYVDPIKNTTLSPYTKYQDYLSHKEAESELWKLSGSGVPSGVNAEVVNVSSAEDVNEWWANEGYANPPYKSATAVSEIQLTQDTTFVHVYSNKDHKYGFWLTRAEDIDGLTPEEIQDLFSLPATPAYVVDVTLPAGTTLRTGIANAVTGWGVGGGVQFDTLKTDLISYFSGTGRKLS